MTIMIKTDNGMKTVGESEHNDIQGVLSMLSFHRVISVELEKEVALEENEGVTTQDLRINYEDEDGIPQTFIIDIFRNG